MQREKRTAAAFIYLRELSESCCSGTQNILVENRVGGGNCHRHTEVRVWREQTRPLSGSSCQSPVEPTVNLLSSSAVWSGPDLGPL